jgi:hypothetical protein
MISQNNIIIFTVLYKNFKTVTETGNEYLINLLKLKKNVLRLWKQH